MKKSLAGILFLLFPLSIAFGMENVFGREAVFMNFYALGDGGSNRSDSFEKFGGGAFWGDGELVGLLGLEVDSVPSNGSHYGFLGVASQSPVFFVIMPIRPVFALGILDGTLGWRVGFDLGGVVGFHGERRGGNEVVAFLGASFWKNVDGLEIKTISMGVGF